LNLVFSFQRIDGGSRFAGVMFEYRVERIATAASYVGSTFVSNTRYDAVITARQTFRSVSASSGFKSILTVCGLVTPAGHVTPDPNE
jgi:hypothetical protein